jgi:hypothetical protein
MRIVNDLARASRALQLLSEEDEPRLLELGVEDERSRASRRRRCRGRSPLRAHGPRSRTRWRGSRTRGRCAPPEQRFTLLLDLADAWARLGAGSVPLSSLREVLSP